MSAAILAGGRASRFGGIDKAALLIGGERIIDRQLAAVSAVASEIFIIGNEPQRFAGLGIPVIPDVVAGAGPIGGIATALQAAGHDWVLVLACDLPFVTAALLERLAAARDENVDLVLPRSVRGVEPLCAVYARSILPLVRQRIDDEERQLAALAALLRVREIGPDALAELDRDGRLFENVNTPHDYGRAIGAVKKA